MDACWTISGDLVWLTALHMRAADPPAIPNPTIVRSPRLPQTRPSVTIRSGQRLLNAGLMHVQADSRLRAVSLGASSAHCAKTQGSALCQAHHPARCPCSTTARRYRRAGVDGHLAWPALSAQHPTRLAPGRDRPHGRRAAGHHRHYRRGDCCRAGSRPDLAPGDRAGCSQGEPARPAGRRCAQAGRRDNGCNHLMGRAPRRHPGLRHGRHRRGASYWKLEAGSWKRTFQISSTISNRSN